MFIVYNKLTVTNMATIRLLKLYQNPFGSIRSNCSNAYVTISRATPLNPIKSGIVIICILYRNFKGKSTFNISIIMKTFLDKILHTPFHIGWVFTLLGVSMIVCLYILVESL